LQPESQKLLWRILANSGDRDFSQEEQKDRRREMGVALPPAGRWCWAAAAGIASRGCASSKAVKSRDSRYQQNSNPCRSPLRERGSRDEKVSSVPNSLFVRSHLMAGVRDGGFCKKV
jgi:hypothetical protein